MKNYFNLIVIAGCICLMLMVYWRIRWYYGNHRDEIVGDFKKAVPGMLTMAAHTHTLTIIAVLLLVLKDLILINYN